MSAMGAMALLPSLVYAGPRPRVSEEVLLGIQKSRARYVAALKRNDVATITELSTADAVVVSPDRIIKVKSDIQAVFAEALRAGRFEESDLKLTSDHLEVDGDTAIETGTLWVRTRLPGQQPSSGTGKYVIIWEEQDGSWKFHRFGWALEALSPETAASDSMPASR